MTTPSMKLLSAAGGGATTFSPDDITNLRAWYDASDAASFTYGAGTQVATWNDKSGNGYHASRTASADVDRNATVNGLDAVTFGGVSSSAGLIADAGSDAITLTTWTFWAVVDLAAADSFGRIMSSRRSATPGADFQAPNAIFAYRASSTSGVYTIGAFSDGASTTQAGSADLKLVRTRFDGSNIYVSVNGTESAGVSATAPDPQRYLVIGQGAGGSGAPPLGTNNACSGVICELIVASTDDTSSDPTTYLTDKWGL